MERESNLPYCFRGNDKLGHRNFGMFHCGDVATLIRDCECVAYYILTEGNKTRLFIHQGTHNHLVAKGVLRAAIKRTRTLVERVMSEVPSTGPRHMQLHLAKVNKVRFFKSKNDSVPSYWLSKREHRYSK